LTRTESFSRADGYKVNWRRYVARAISEVFALSRIRSADRSGFRILMYHSVGSEVPGDWLEIFGITSDLFSQHAELLARYPTGRVTPLDMAHLEGNGQRIAITFDDGYKDNLRIAAPILLERGLPFTVFVTSGFVRPNERLFMTPGELRELSELPNVSIGSHGVSHVALTKCDDRALWQELASSKRFLEDIIGKKITSVAYPYGAVDRRVRDMAQKAGYESGFCSYEAINNPSQDPLLMSRTCILGLDSIRVFKQKLHGDWDWYRWRQRNPARS